MPQPAACERNFTHQPITVPCSVDSRLSVVTSPSSASRMPRISSLRSAEMEPIAERMDGWGDLRERDGVRAGVRVERTGVFLAAVVLRPGAARL